MSTDDTDTGDQFDRAARAHWEKHCRRISPITLKPFAMTASDRIDIERMAGKLRLQARAGDVEEERCELTTMVKTACPHCRTITARQTTVDGAEA